MTPVISVVMTTYNVEPYVKQAIEGMIDQSFREFELIVIDDGSTDKTWEIISAISQSDNRIKSIHLNSNTKGGVATAANIGIRLAEGNYIAFADGDDIFEPEMLSSLLRIIQSDSADIAIGNYSTLDSDGKQGKPADSHIWKSSNWKKEVATITTDDSEQVQQILRMIPVPWRKLYLKSFLIENEITFPEVPYFWEDNPFHWFAVLSAQKISIQDVNLCYHRVGRPGSTMSSKNDSLLDFFGHGKTIEAWLRHKGLLGFYRTELARWYISQSEWIRPRLSIEAQKKLDGMIQQETSKIDHNQLNTALEGKGASTRNRIAHGDDPSELKHSRLNSRLRESKFSRSLIGQGLSYLSRNGPIKTLKRLFELYSKNNKPASIDKELMLLESQAFMLEKMERTFLERLSKIENMLEQDADQKPNIKPDAE